MTVYVVVSVMDNQGCELVGDLAYTNKARAEQKAKHLNAMFGNKRCKAVGLKITNEQPEP